MRSSLCFGVWSQVSTQSKRAHRTFARLVRDNLRTIIVVVAALIFMRLAQEILAGEAVKLDSWAYELVVVYMRRPWLTPVMQSISELALPVVLIVMLLAVEAFAPGRRPAICAGVNLVLVLSRAISFRSCARGSDKV